MDYISVTLTLTSGWVQPMEGTGRRWEEVGREASKLIPCLFPLDPSSLGE